MQQKQEAPELSMIASNNFKNDRPSSRHLIECLDFLAKLPSSFVLQQLNVVGDGCDAAKTRTRIRKLYEQYKREDYNSPTLLGALQMQVTVQCLTNLSENGHIKAQQRISELEQELSNTKKALKEASLKPTDSTAMQPGHSKTLARPAALLETAIEAPVKRRVLPWLVETPDLHNHKRKAVGDPWCFDFNAETAASPLKRGRPGRPLQPVRKHLVRLRQPQATDAWYSTEFPQLHEDRTRLDHATKRQYSNVGNIEETDAGQLTDDPCTNCEEAGYTCKMYNPATVALYCGQLDWQTCSRCRYHKDFRPRNTRPCTLAHPKFIGPRPAWLDSTDDIEPIDMDKVWSEPLQIGKPKESRSPLG
ncbi:hypothetical protein Slin14017_G023170 [Septoria linicola]|nr:hypothetical protein Slin14017_G023170 [Septoria linicola]